MDILIKERLNAIFLMLISVITLLLVYFFYESAENYQAKTNQVFFDLNNKPVGLQDLLSEANHNTDYRKGKEGVADYGRDFLLSTYNFTNSDLQSGFVLKRFKRWYSKDTYISAYNELLLNSSILKIVEAQNAIVESRTIGDLKINGIAKDTYISMSGLRLESKIYHLTGKMLLVVHGYEDYPTLYNVDIIVQRVLLQDKLEGYQVVELGLSK